MIRKQNGSIKEIKQIERKQKTENIVEDIDLGRFFEIGSSDKIYVNNINLHENKNESLQDYTGDLKLNGKVIIGPVEHTPNIRFQIMVVFENYINAKDIDYDNEDVTSTGYAFKLNTSRFNVVNRSLYGKETNYMQQMVEYHGKNCYIPTSGKCFIKCVKYFTKKDFTAEFLTFIRNEKYRSGVLISAKIQSFCREYSINIGCFD